MNEIMAAEIGAFASITEVYDTYKLWWKDSFPNNHALDRPEFILTMNEYMKFQTQDGHFWVGHRINDGCEHIYPEAAAAAAIVGVARGKPSLVVEKSAPAPSLPPPAPSLPLPLPPSLPPSLPLPLPLPPDTTEPSSS
jgi:hypothetical protein